MFRTSKFFLAGALVAFAGTAAHAQSADQGDMLAGLLASAGATGTPGKDAASDQLRAAITAKIMDIATTSRRVAANGDAVTIQELDDLNRTAERAKTELELERLEVERMKTELDSLLALYTAIQTLEVKEDVQPSYQEQAFEMDQIQQRVAAAAEPSDREVENVNLPRVIGIMGVAGNYEAGLAFPDGSRMSVTKGEYLESGFSVVEVGAGYVKLKGEATGAEYRLSPKGEPQPRPQDGGMELGGPRQAADMNGMPFGIF